MVILELLGMHRMPDHETSIDAARSVRWKISGLRQKILNRIAESEEYGCTDDELRRVEEFAGYAHSTVGKRRTELFQMGLLVSAGVRDGYTVWILNPDRPTQGDA
jgi:hypothetical protein